MRIKLIIAVLGLSLCGNVLSYHMDAKACQFGELTPMMDKFNERIALERLLEEQAHTIEIDESAPVDMGTFEVTAYCGCTECTPGLMETYTGTYPVEGRTISVDPEVIPLGSTVYIDGLGTFTAEDTGSAIKGNIIDLYLEDHSDTEQFGRQTYEVYLVK